MLFKLSKIVLALLSNLRKIAMRHLNKKKPGIVCFLNLEIVDY